MKLSLVIEAIDKASRNVKRITGNVRDLGTRGMGVVQRATQGANRQLDRFGRGTAGRLRTLSVAAARFAGRTGLRAIEIGAEKAGWALGRLIRKGFDLAASTAKWGVAAAGFFAGWGIREIIKTGAQFEDFQAVLEGTEGSVAKAKSALSWVQKFAKDTPYELAEVTDAFVRARGVGIDPMGGAFKNMGDAASGARKSIMDAVEAIADAQTGEFERLKEFNITTSVAGAKVTFSYLDKAGKNMTRTVSKNMRDIQRTVLEIFGEKYADGMIRRSRTLNGIWSNIKDSASGFFKMIADAGFFDTVKSKLQAILGQTDKMAANGSLAKWAKNISDWLVKMTDEAWNFIRNTDWNEVAGHLKNVATLVWWIVKGLSAIVGLASKAADGFRWMRDTRTSDWLGLTEPKKERPFSVPGDKSAKWPGKASDRLRPVPSAAPLKSGHQPVKWPAKTSLAAPMKGEVTVRVEAAQGTRARVSSASSSSSLSLNATSRGRAMEAPA